MSLEPLGIVPASAAGSHVAQTSGTDVQRSQLATTNQQRRAAARERAESAAGIPATDGQDLKPNDREVDGRSPWEIRPRQASSAAKHDERPATLRETKDGDDRGARLDVVG